MKKLLFLAVLAFSSLSFAWDNEYGVIQSTFQLQLTGNAVFYRNGFHDGDKYSVDDDSQLNLIPTIRIRPVPGIEFNFTYPLRDDGLKNATGFWGPILGLKYGGPSSAGFLEFVFPAGAKKLLGNGDDPAPALIFGGTNFFGNWESFGIRLHSWYFWDFNDHSGDEFYFLVRPEFNAGAVRIGLGFPFEFMIGGDHGWIDNAPGTVRGMGGNDDDEIGYTMSISIQPKVTINLGKINLEPYFSIPLWKYTSETASMVYGYTLGMDAKLNI